jgi:non-specific serine/threonine protein kinase/serine/threonine-protein kinase
VEPERWQEIDRIYHAALELDKSQQLTFIDKACGRDESLQQEVRSLLAQAESANSFLETPALEVAAKSMAMSAGADGTMAPSLGRPPGETGYPTGFEIGRYRVIRLLGEGGMGAVYEAEQNQPRRAVALKMIKAGFATAETLRRFQHESQALGRLQHPGIAQIYEAGSADAGQGAQPYFAMEFVRGQTLQEYLAKHQLNSRERLTLMAKICDAVEHAHQRGVIHRDLKPSNISGG